MYTVKGKCEVRILLRRLEYRLQQLTDFLLAVVSSSSLPPAAEEKYAAEGTSPGTCTLQS